MIDYSLKIINNFSDEDYLRKEAERILKSYLGQEANFREGQLESIISVLLNDKTLVIQKTGWGKTLIYIIATLLLRKKWEQDRGQDKKGRPVTFVISPLIALMSNQAEEIKRIGKNNKDNVLSCQVLNSENEDWDKKNREKIIAKLKEKKNKTDIVFITPESFVRNFKEHLSEINIGLLVIDEVHCVTEWGHDFRLEYGAIGAICSDYDEKHEKDKLRILATTATCPDTVKVDLEKQFGTMNIVRGNLLRDDIKIQILDFESKADKLAWLEVNIPMLISKQKKGIIYCLTKRDVDEVVGYINQKCWIAEKNDKKIALRYYSADSNVDKEEINNNLEIFDQSNNLKTYVLVSTIKLGMGYDSPDIDYVIHYQKPKDLISYYQQIGRAGRSKEIFPAYALLMNCEEDDKIVKYFNMSTLSFEVVKEIYMQFKNSCEHEIDVDVLQEKCNYSSKVIEKTVDLLCKRGFLTLCSFKTYKLSKINKEELENIKNELDTLKNIKENNIDNMTKYLTEKQNACACKNRLLIKSLGDNTKTSCKQCPYKGLRDIIEFKEPNKDTITETSKFLNSTEHIIEFHSFSSRKQYSDKTNIDCRNSEGYYLYEYDKDKYEKFYSNDKAKNINQYIDKITRVFEKLEELNDVLIVPIPNKGKDVKLINIIKGIVDKMNESKGKQWNYIEDLIFKTEKAKPQMEMKNLKQKRNNIQGAFEINECYKIVDLYDNKELSDSQKLLLNSKHIILFDNLVWSKWTLTEVGNIIQKEQRKAIFKDDKRKKGEGLNTETNTDNNEDHESIIGKWNKEYSVTPFCIFGNVNER